MRRLLKILLMYVTEKIETISFGHVIYRVFVHNYHVIMENSYVFCYIWRVEL